MADALLLLHIDIEVAHHHDPALSADALLAAVELAGDHIALEDVNAVLLFERHAASTSSSSIWTSLIARLGTSAA